MTPYSVKKGTSVYELLKKTGLDIKVTRSAYGVYVKAIEGLAEFDEGSGSGWMYRVNGNFPNYSASLYSLSKGDYVEWLYTRDLGEDLGGSSYESSSGGSNKNTASSGTSAVVQPSEIINSAVFNDVEKGSWYEEAVSYVVGAKLFKGVSETEFAPDEAMTRAMLVTVLYRLENPEEKVYEHSFTDVASGEWYTDAVAWAAANGVVKGISETEFAPEDNITREQMAVIIYRYAELKGYDITDFADISQFDDVNDISDWALDAIRWTIAAEIINGTSSVTSSPNDMATRAQVAAILMRFCENVAK